MVYSICFGNDVSKEMIQQIMASGTLLMPTISHGNVDQMIIDLIINSCHKSGQLKRIASIYSSHFQSIAGVSAVSTGENTVTSPALGMERGLRMYWKTDSPFMILQLRSQPKEGYTSAFVQDLIHLSSELMVNQVILFSAADSTFYDSSVVRSTLSFFTTSPVVLDLVGERIPSINTVKEELVGTGLLSLLQSSFIEKSILFSTFAMFITEGRNFTDALSILRRINQVMTIVSEDTLVIPETWLIIDPWLNDEC